MSSISDEIREIDQEIANLYRRKRFLEMQQQMEWEKLYPPLTARVDERPDFLLGGNYAFDDEWSGTLLG